MLKPLSLLLCSFFALSFTLISVLAVRHEAQVAPIGHRLLQYLRRQVDDGSSSTTSDSGIQSDTFSTDATSSTDTTDTMMFTALGNAAPIDTQSSSAMTVTSIITTTMPLTTVTSTSTVTTTSTGDSPSMTTTTTVPVSVTTVTTTETSIVTTTVFITVTPTDSQPSTTSSDSESSTTSSDSSPSTATASDCATLNTELDGSPYTAPMGDQYTLECRSFYYTDDDNTLATYYGVDSFRACADLCDAQDGCNIFFLGTDAAGDQAMECFLLSSDIYGQATDSDIADSGVRVGYVSEQLD